ncbi:hypothetical protein H0H93_006068 [Arthromyces matolae]|nr:hypothetical protein H0H93_006068 [Arthromyces matolae]
MPNAAPLYEGFQSYQGTSTAAPQVAGILACLISAYGNHSPEDMKKILLSSSVRGGVVNLREQPSLCERPKRFYSDVTPAKDAPNNLLAHLPPEVSGYKEPLDKNLVKHLNHNL